MSAEPFPRRATAWYALVVLMLCYTLSYIDRQILAFLVEPLKHELSIGDAKIGLLQGIYFAMFYTFVGLPMGWLADRYNRRNIIAAGVLFWSLMTALSGAARSYLMLALARMGVGVGESTTNPCAFSMISDLFPREQLSTAMSVYMMGIQLGSGLALIIGGVVVQAVSDMPPLTLPLLGTLSPWRLTFLAVGLPGLLVTLLVFTFREPPRRAVMLNEHGKAAQAKLSVAIREVGKRWQSVFGLAFIIASQALCNYTLLSWGPSFFGRVHHWPRDRIGLVLGLITLGSGCIGLISGGRLADYWQKRGVSDGTLVGGGLGAVGGAAIGGATTNSVGGAVVGGLLGAVAGGIAGTAIDQNSTRRGIEVTVQKDDGQRVTIAQRDDGDVQMGDRVAIVYDRNGVAKAVRDTGYRRD